MQQRSTLINAIQWIDFAVFVRDSERQMPQITIHHCPHPKTKI